MEDTTQKTPLATGPVKEKDIDDLVHSTQQPEEPSATTAVDGDDLVHAMPPPAPSPEQDPDDAVHEAAIEPDVADDRV